MITPPGVSLNTTTRKYPALIYVYGGPGSQTVTKQYALSGTRARWHFFLASQGYIVVSVDNRGTGGRYGDYSVQRYAPGCDTALTCACMCGRVVGYFLWCAGARPSCRPTSTTLGRRRCWTSCLWLTSYRSNTMWMPAR